MMRALVSFIRENKLLFSIDNLVVLLAGVGLRIDLKVRKAA